MDDKKLQLDITSLAEDQAFIRWVKQGTLEDQWTAWLESHPDQMDKVKEAKTLVNALSFTNDSLPINKEKLWNRIEASTDATVVQMEENTGNVRRLYRRSFIGIAASAAILLSIMFFLKDSIDIIAPAGESITHVLPDGSKVYVNAGSEISYDKKSWDSRRSIELNGEAFFEVEKGSKFSVSTDNGSVQVLGTKFNVYSRGNAFNVKCTEGKVRVNARSSEEILEAGDVVQLENGKLTSIPFQAKYDWRKSTYTYKAATLVDVFSEIERQFDIEVNADADISAMPYTGPLETKDLKKAVYMVTWPMGLDYKIEGKTVQIVKK